MVKREYSKEDIDYMLKFWGIFTMEKIAKDLSRTLASIKCKANSLRKLSYKLDSNLDHSEEQKQKHNEKISNKLKSGYDKPSVELSYLLGVLNGDGCLTNRRVFNLRTIDFSFAKKFKHCLEKWSGIKSKIYKTYYADIYQQGYCYDSRLNSVIAFNFLQQFYCKINTDNSIDNLSKFLSNDERKISFIEGFFDSEGCIDKSRIRFANTNKAYLEFLSSIISHFNIKLSIYKTIKSNNKDRKDVFNIQIHRKVDRIKFCQIFNSCIKRKQDRILECRNLKH